MKNTNENNITTNETDDVDIFPEEPYPWSGFEDEPNDETAEMLVDMSKKEPRHTLFRENIIRQIMGVLISSGKPNCTLIGDAGTGKTQIIEELAYRMARNDPTVPVKLRGYKIYSLQLSDIVAGCGLMGALERKLKRILDYLSDDNNKAIVFLDEIHLLYSFESYKIIAQIIKPALSRGDIRVIAATTTQESKVLDTDPAFNRRFSKIIVDELSKEQTCNVLMSLGNSLSSHYGMRINIGNSLAALTVDIADDFCFAGSHRPDNAITLLDRTIANCLIEQKGIDNENKSITINEECLRETAYKITSGNSEAKKFDEDELRHDLSCIQGQNDIVDDIIKTIKLHDMHIRPCKKPLTFLFAGSSGVGKSEITKLLAKSYTCDKPIILNMTEYHSPSSINRIIGAPAGYIGSNSNAEMPFDSLDSNPYRIILLDEFEKCDKSVQRLFMSVFDEGELKTNHGKTIDFSKSIIIATTNAGCTIKHGAIGFVNKPDSKYDIHSLSDYFDIELLNRFSHIYTFHSITKQVYRDIMAKSYIKEVENIRNCSHKAKLPACLSDNEIQILVDKSYDEKLGARPVKTIITEFIDEKLLSA